MHPTLQHKTETTDEKTPDTTGAGSAAGELAVIVELLATVGLDAGAVFEGDAERCPHCLSQVLSEAA
jgi:hypothetical protein